MMESSVLCHSYIVMLSGLVAGNKFSMCLGDGISFSIIKIWDFVIYNE